jgi:hypothetical protein
MNTRITRRELLKLAGTGLASLALLPADLEPKQSGPWNLARVAIHSVSVYSQPWDKSRILFQRYRDDILHIYAEVTSEYGPAWNPRWYRVWGGYVHSGSLQRVRYQLNPISNTIPEKGLLSQVTVPLTQSMRFNHYTGWAPLYRLYYQSMHWIMGVDEGPDGQPWYRLKDELLGIEYHVPAAHLQPIDASILTPLSPEVSPEKKRIEVSLALQTVKAFEDDRLVWQTRCSSGQPQRTKVEGEIPTETPRGTFHIQNKMPSKHMGDGKPTNDLEAYELPGVPWVSFFEPITGVAFHGTYWHTNFGITMSHGCVNLTWEDSLWIFRWATPTSQVDNWSMVGMGTLVTVT